MVTVTTIHRRKVIGEKLERYHFEDWQKQFRRWGDKEYLVSDLQNSIFAFGSTAGRPSRRNEYPATLDVTPNRFAQGSRLLIDFSQYRGRSLRWTRP